MTRASELTTFHQDELVSRLDEARKELTALKFRAATNQLSDVSSISKLKKEVARLITILHERELGVVHIAPKPKEESDQGAKFQKVSGRLYGTKARIAEKELEEAQKGSETEDEEFEDLSEVDSEVGSEVGSEVDNEATDTDEKDGADEQFDSDVESNDSATAKQDIVDDKALKEDSDNES